MRGAAGAPLLVRFAQTQYRPRGGFADDTEMKDAGDDVQRLKSALAAEIRRMLDLLGLSVREAQARTGIAAADFSRIRSSVDLRRFTIDRLMAIINRLGSRIDVDVKLRRPEAGDAVPLSTSP